MTTKSSYDKDMREMEPLNISGIENFNDRRDALTACVTRNNLHEVSLNDLLEMAGYSVKSGVNSRGQWEHVLEKDGVKTVVSGPWSYDEGQFLAMKSLGHVY